MRGNPFSKISIRLEKDTLGELTALAAAEGVTVSEYIRQILNDFLDTLS